MNNIEALEKRLWGAADQLRANSGLGSNEYFLPVLGILFLRHAYNRYSQVAVEIERSLPERGGVKRAVAKDDFTKRRSIYLREESQYEYLTNLPGDTNTGKSINRAMELIEEDYESLRGILPRNYEAFGDDLLRSILRTFNDEVLQRASGDVFGRIYEYFLLKFSMAGAHDNGEFFTPPSIVQTIVNVIEPDHGIVFDPAAGSAGMFVQTSHFIESKKQSVEKSVTFFGQEKNETTIRIAKMNLAVHGLEGNIIKGNTFYEDHHEMFGKADFVMANPPFNVDTVDADKIKNDPRLPFGLPGINKSGAVSNGNYLWISYFYSYINPNGRAGFVMSSQASSAGHGEKTVRKKIIDTGHVDVMVSIRSNFFYTRSVPCELWFFDKGKAKDRLNKVLMIDARNIYRKVTRKINDFSPEQLKNIASIIWLYRGQNDKYINLVQEYLTNIITECETIRPQLEKFETELNKLREQLDAFSKALYNADKVSGEHKNQFNDDIRELEETYKHYEKDRAVLVKEIDNFLKKNKSISPTNPAQVKAREELDSITERQKGLMKQIELVAKLAVRSADHVKNFSNSKNGLPGAPDRREILKNARQFMMPKNDDEETTLLKDALYPLKQSVYFHKQIHWLQTRFPDAKLRDVDGLVKLVDRSKIEENDWSLTPGRYVGVAPPEEDDDFDFEETLREIHVELADLNKEAEQLSTTIQKNFEELGI
jgi:type I restriction enzyme M protein